MLRADPVSAALAQSPRAPAIDRQGRRAQWQWRINRLRCMSPTEIAHRVWRLGLAQAEGRVLEWLPGMLGRAPVADLTRHSACWVRVPGRRGEIDAAPYVAAAERIAAGRFDVFALRDIDLGSPPRWNRDPKTGITAPLTFGMLLDYRDPARVGDIKYVWEPNRHLHLPVLAQAYALTGDRRHFDTIAEHLQSWFEQCPYGLGVNWSSALEAGLRLINWSITWQLLGGAASPLFASGDGQRFMRRWLASVYQHACFIRRHFSLHSSANNHLIGEAAGLFIGALTWPHWPRAQSWRRASRAILEREILLQNAPDGVNREQSVAYQHFVLDLLLLSWRAGAANGEQLSIACRDRMIAMLEFLASIIDHAGNVPMIGDADDGVAVSLARDESFCRYRSLLATGAVLFGRRDFKAVARNLDDKSRWLLGPGADREFAALGTPAACVPLRRAFPDGGYYILGADFGTSREIRVLADAGPLGYRGIAAHGHADALAFTLSIGGVEFLVDPGTYAYHTEGEWRRYFRGTAAHNTLRVDGVDQSEQGGNFLWLKKADARCTRWESTAAHDVFEGVHDGYGRLGDPVRHRRTIVFDKRARRIVIEDALQMRGEHQIELFFHCGERCAIEATPAGYALNAGDRTLSIRLPRHDRGVTTLHYGSLAPCAGWISRSFDDKQPAATLYWTARLSGDTSLRTELLIQADYRDPWLRAPAHNELPLSLAAMPGCECRAAGAGASPCAGTCAVSHRDLAGRAALNGEQQ